MKKKKSHKLKIVILCALVLLLTGCQTTLTDEDNKAVQNPETGQSLTGNILCQPTNEQTIALYEENGVDIEELPKCTEFQITSGGYEGLWTSIFVKPLAFVILWIGKHIGSYAVSIIIITILIRFLIFPLTKKMSVQSELMKKAQPELQRIQKKYANKTDQDSMLKQNQEMMMVYQKYHFNPFTSCLVSFIQLPLFFAFLEAINRIPAIFEERFLGLQLGTSPVVGFGTNTIVVYIILMILIGVTTVMTFKINASTQGAGPSSKMMPIFMSIIIIITALFMPAALGIYWVVQNAFAIVQSIIIKKGMEKKNGKA